MDHEPFSFFNQKPDLFFKGSVWVIQNTASQTKVLLKNCKINCTTHLRTFSNWDNREIYFNHLRTFQTEVTDICPDFGRSCYWFVINLYSTNYQSLKRFLFLISITVSREAVFLKISFILNILKDSSTQTLFCFFYKAVILFKKIS